MRARGLALSIPPIVVRVRSPLAVLAAQIHALYRDYELADPEGFADVDIRMVPVKRGATLGAAPGPIRRRRRHAVRPVSARPCAADVRMGTQLGLQPSDARHLLLHAAAVERDGRALRAPRMAGIGQEHARGVAREPRLALLSDEFGIVTFARRRPLPFAAARSRSRTSRSTSCARSSPTGSSGRCSPQHSQGRRRAFPRAGGRACGAASESRTPRPSCSLISSVGGRGHRSAAREGRRVPQACRQRVQLRGRRRAGVSRRRRADPPLSVPHPALRRSSPARMRRSPTSCRAKRAGESPRRWRAVASERRRR